jgi:hypothetical protein
MPINDSHGRTLDQANIEHLRSALWLFAGRARYQLAYVKNYKVGVHQKQKPNLSMNASLTEFRHFLEQV